MKSEARSIKNVHLVSHLIEERPKSGQNLPIQTGFGGDEYSMHSMTTNDPEAFIYNDLNSIDSARAPSAFIMHHAQPHADCIDAAPLSTIVSSGRPPGNNEISKSPILLRRPTMDLTGASPSPREYHHQRSKSKVSKVRLIKQKLQHNGNYHSLEEPSYDILDEDVLYDFENFSFKQQLNDKLNDRSKLVLQPPPPHPMSSIQDLHTLHDNSPHDYKSHVHVKPTNFVWKVLSLSFQLLFFLVFCSLIINLVILRGFNNQILDFKVDALTNVLITEDILMVDVETSAINFNYQDINIWDLDLDIFITTKELSTSTGADKGISTVTILLGNSKRFLTPLTFQNDYKPFNATAQLKLYKPGQSFIFNDSHLTHEQWLKIFNTQFKLIIRGNLKYQLPLSWNPEIININSETTVNTLF